MARGTTLLIRARDGQTYDIEGGIVERGTNPHSGRAYVLFAPSFSNWATSDERGKPTRAASQYHITLVQDEDGHAWVTPGLGYAAGFRTTP